MFLRNRMIGSILGMTLCAASWAKSGHEVDLRFPAPDFRLSTVGAGQTSSLLFADAGTKSSLSVDDLGFTQEQTKSDPKFQKDLEARSDMLKIHQTLGLITCVPMVGTYVLGYSATKEDFLLHGGMGFATTGLYLTTASFAIFAPHVEGVKSTGNSDLHQLLAILHGICMVAAPITGEMAEHGGQDMTTLHFINNTALVASFMAAMAVMTF